MLTFFDLSFQIERFSFDKERSFFLEFKIKDYSEQITDKAGWPLLDFDYTVAMSHDQQGEPHALHSSIFCELGDNIRLAVLAFSHFSLSFALGSALFINGWIM
jgi:hypothetical protein